MKTIKEVFVCCNQPKTSFPNNSEEDKPENNAYNINKDINDEENAETSNAGGESSSRAVLTFTYEELKKATENFQFLNLKGEGGFCKVYEGNLQINHNKLKRVAIKKIHDVTRESERQFNAEVSILGLADHPNIVNLIGYCSEGDHHRFLVYEYMPLGSLDAHLQGGARREALVWDTRNKIASHAAMGLQYLHQGLKPPVVYGSVKCSKILLGQRYAMTLTDFGLAREGPVFTHDANSSVMGTDGYCDPGYVATGVLTLKSDIYRFGVALLKLFTGRGPVLVTTTTTCVNLAEWAAALFKDKNLLSQIADPMLQGQYPESEMHEALTIAASCVQPEAEKRPNAAALVESVTSLRMQRPELEGRPKHRRTCSLPPGICSTDPKNKKNAGDKPSTSNTVPESQLARIPEAVLEDILFKLPVKQLRSLKEVCPDLNKLISSSTFTLAHMKYSASTFPGYVVYGIKSQFMLLDVSSNNLRPPKQLGFCPPVRKPSSSFEIIGVSEGLVCVQRTYDFFWNLIEEVENESCFQIFNPGLEEFVEIPNPFLNTYAIDSWFGKFSTSLFSDYCIISRFQLQNDFRVRSDFYFYSLRTKEWRISQPLNQHFTNYHKFSRLTTTVENFLYLSLRNVSQLKEKTIIGVNLQTNEIDQRAWMDWLDQYRYAEFFCISNRLSLHCWFQNKSDFWSLIDPQNSESWQLICTMDRSRTGILATNLCGSFLTGCLEHRKEILGLWPGDESETVTIREEYLLHNGCGFYFETLISPFLFL